MDTESILVIDIGTGYIKVGFSGEDIPRLIIPSLICEHLNKIYIGQDAVNIYNNNNEEIVLIYPIEKCTIKDYDAMIKIIEHIYTTLKIESDKYPVYIILILYIQY